MSVWLPSASHRLAGRIFRPMPVEFLTDDEAAYGRYVGVPLQEELDRMFFLDFSHRPSMCTRRAEYAG